MIYKCKKCGFIHEGEMPDGYFCPLCYASLFDFKLESAEEEQYNRIPLADDNPAINRTLDKCINCGACTNTCQNKVGVHYKNPDKPICLYCGQCILTCPTGALTPKYDYQTVWELINVPGKVVVVMTSPAVRVALGDAYGYPPGEFLEGKMIAALKAIGFDYVFDTAFGADLTAIEEANELKQRIEKEGVLPMFSSCCPSWVKYAEVYHPKLKEHLSTCKSPIGMQATVLKEIFAKEEEINPDDLILVALTPCTAKKYEIIKGNADYVITTSELAFLLREQNLDFKNLAEAKYDSVIGSSSGMIFGKSGGVALATLRVLYQKETGKDLTSEMLAIKDKGFYQEYSIKMGRRLVKCAVLYSMMHLEQLLPIMSEFVFIEVMNCIGGCVGGGGQIIMPVKDMPAIIAARQKGLQNKDQKAKLKYAYDNAIAQDLYEDYFEQPMSEKSEALLHHKGVKKK